MTRPRSGRRSSSASAAIGSSTSAARARDPIPLGLFLATAAFVVWRLTEIGALVDIAYILNTASRIAAGDVPYSGFRLAHPPLTFLGQAALIRVLGPHYLVHVAYAAVAGGAASVLAYHIVRRVLDGVVGRPRLVAGLLCAALVPLGIYSIFPHPHYDPDAALAILAALVAVLVARERRTPGWWLLAGALLVVPLFVKQNIGGAFLPLALAAVAADLMRGPGERAQLAWCAAGAVAAMGTALLAIQLVAGLDAYLRWTVAYAMAERGVIFERVGWFFEPRAALLGILLPVVAMATSLACGRAGAVVAGLAIGLPLAVVAGINVVLLWAPLAIAAVLVATAGALRGRLELEANLPLVCVGTLAGALQSQGLGGSSFATFPMLVITLAGLMRGLRAFTLDEPVPRVLGVVVAVLLLVSGTAYTLGNERMRFANANAAGGVQRSTFPALAGLSARGPYVGEVDEILAWVQANVRYGEPITFVPGEDPIGFALGLRPGLPVVQYIDGSLPYTPAELASIADASGLRWVVVKELLQLADGSPEEAIRAQAAITRSADVVAVVGPYRIYRRR